MFLMITLQLFSKLKVFSQNLNKNALKFSNILNEITVQDTYGNGNGKWC